MTWHHHEPQAAGAVWMPCATCWGQRRLLTVPEGGGGLVPTTCPSCLGVGERLADGRGVPAPTPEKS